MVGQADGPTNPARLPSELITAIPAAASALAEVEGNVQKTGRLAKMPTRATQSEIIFSVGLSPVRSRMLHKTKFNGAGGLRT